MKVVIYTDGACSGNPGPAGWAAILKYGEAERIVQGGSRCATNNQAELYACIESLKSLKKPCQVDLYSDSAYIVNAFLQDWFSKWIKNDWRNSRDDPIKNKDLWLELLHLVGHPEFGPGIHQVSFHKVKGHAGVELNERCDALAGAERDFYKN